MAAPPAVYPDEPTPNNRIMVAEGNAHQLTFYFASFVEIRSKCATHLDGNLTESSWSHHLVGIR